MGQTLSDRSRTVATSGRAKWKADETTQRLRIRRFRSGEKSRGDHLNGNPMKNKVLSCLGRRKRDSSQSGVDLGCENRAGETATRCDHRVGKLPRDEVVSTAGKHRASLGCLEAQSGRDDNTEAAQHAVKREATPGPSDATGLEIRTCEVSTTGCEEPKQGREDNESDPPTRAMEDKSLEGKNLDCVVSEDREQAGIRLSSATRFHSRTGWTSSSLTPDQVLDRKPSLTDNQVDAEMTKTDCSAASGPPKAAGDQNNCCAVKPESRKDNDHAHDGPQGGQSYPGTIPKLIITRDPSPTRCQGPPALLSARTELSSGLSLDFHPDDESPCSDSGCGGSPALMRSPRKLSNSSSIGLSSASSFEESEDDFTGSDIESSLSPARSLCSPDDATGVSLFFTTTWYKWSPQYNTKV